MAGVPAAELVVVNRSQAAACELAGRCGSRAAGLDRLEAELRRADALVCATGAPRPTVGAGAVERAVAGRRRPLLIVDLAVPRDVEPAAANVPGVTLHDIDAVQQHVSRNTSARRRAAMAAGSMVRHEATRFTTWRRELEAAAALQVVWRQAEELRRAELTRHGEGALSAAERERLDHVTASLMRRLLHGRSERLREACAEPGAAAHVESFRMLFGVDAARAPAADVIAVAEREAA